MPLRSTLLLPLCLIVALFTLNPLVSARAETFRNPHRVPLAVDPDGVATGDLNGDGRSDIVWTELGGFSGTAVLHVLLATGNGQYAPASDLSLPFAPTLVHCIVEDVTGDNRNDLVCVGASDNYIDTFLLTYAGQGDGTFAAPVQTTVEGAVSFNYPILARAGDLNGDGRPDVIVMNAYYSDTLPYLSDGKGGFTLGPAFNGSFNFSVPVIADVNGDGKLDVLWPFGPRVNLGNGDGSFSEPAQYDPGYDSECAFGDVDHDGHLDAVCTWVDNADLDGQVQLTVLHGNSDGSFAQTPIFTRKFGNGESEYDGSPTILAPVLIADLNGDGYADIVSLSGDGYSVLLGGANSTWSGKPQQFVVASWQSKRGLIGIYGVSMADMNGDGLTDIVAIGVNGLYITYAQADGSLSSAPATELGQVSTSSALVDVNGDGNLDAVSAGDIALKVSLGVGDGTFGAPQAITMVDNFSDAPYAEGHVISGDFNGDGKQDLLATGNVGVYETQNYILFGHGDGSFDTPKPIDNSIVLAKVADLNKDGRSDVISIQNNSIATNVLVASLSKGDGTFSTVSTTLAVEAQPGGFFYASVGPALADFRHSGRLDVAVASFNNAYLLRSHGDGSFDTTSAPLALPDLPDLTKVGSFDVTAGDFDGDGNQDIAVLAQYGNGEYNLSTQTSAVWVFYGNGDGTFSTATLAGTFNREAQTLTAGDLNGDGLDDLVVTSDDVYEYTGVLVVHALANRGWGPEVDYTGGDGMSPLWITDINHDGRNDMVFSNADGLSVANSISVLLNEQDNTVEGTVTASPEPSNVTYPFTLKASLVPPNASDSLTGSVTFLLDGTAIGTGALAGNAATFDVTGTGIAAGIHTLSASWPGDTTHTAAVTLNGRHTVSLLPLNVSLTADPTSVSAGGSVTATATFTPGIVPTTSTYQFTGTMTLYDGDAAIAQQPVSPNGFNFVLPSLAVGMHTLTVSYPGDALFAAAKSNAVSVTVIGAASVATLIATPTTSTYGQPVTLAATIAAAGTGPAVPSGTVIFTVDGSALPAVGLTNGVAGTVLASLGVGSHSVSCSYAGDSFYAASTCNTVAVGVEAASSALSITSSQNPSVAYAPVTFSIHLTLNGKPAPAGTSVSFSIAGSTSTLMLTTDATGTAIYTTNQLSVRAWDVEASFSNANYVSSAAKYTQVVNPAPTMLGLTASPNPAYSGQNVTLIATTAPAGTTFPTGPVAFLDGTNFLGSGVINASGVATFSSNAFAVGTHTITASFPGDSGFLAATSAPVTLIVSNANVLLTTDKGAMTVETEHHGGMNVSLESVGGLTGTFVLACGQMPTWASCQFGSPRLSLPANGSVSSTLVIDTDAVYHFKSALEEPGAHGRTGEPSSKFPLVAVASVAWLVFGVRRKGWPGLRSGLRGGLVRFCLPLAVLALAGSMTGCGGKYPDHTAVGSYTVEVTATSVPGSTVVPVSRTVSFTLMVTP